MSSMVGTRGRLISGLLLAVLMMLGSPLAGPASPSLARPEAAPVPLPQTLTGGGPGGSTWPVENTGGTSNGLPVGGSCGAFPGLTVNNGGLGGPPPQGDVFDNGLVVFVNNQVFVAPATVDLTGSTLTAGPVTLSGLNTTVQYFAAPGTATLRQLVSFSNPTGAPITATIAWVSNLGSNGSTIVAGTSSGDTVFTTADRWIVTDDAPVGDRPAVTHVLFGPGAPAVTPATVSQTVFHCSGTEGILSTYNITVPAGTTRRLLFYAQLNQTAASGVAGAATFNTTPAVGSELVSGLSATELAEVVNWQFFPPTATPTSTATATRTSTATVTATATATAVSVPPVVPAVPAPPLSGQAGIPCTTQVGTTCTATGGVTGTLTRAAGFTVTLTATGPGNSVVGGMPRLFLSTTLGVQSLLCTPVTAALQTTCSGSVNGEVLQNSQAIVRFPVAGGGTADIVGVVVGPGVRSLTIAEAIALVPTSGQANVPCASVAGQTCQASGGVNGRGTVGAGMTWTVTAAVPAGVLAGVVPVAVPVAVFSTTQGLQGFACAPVGAGAATVTCTGTTAGNALQGSTVSVVFAAGVVTTGVVTGPGAGAALPLLPPAPPIVLPPLPPPVVPLPPSTLSEGTQRGAGVAGAVRLDAPTDAAEPAPTAEPRPTATATPPPAAAQPLPGTPPLRPAAVELSPLVPDPAFSAAEMPLAPEGEVQADDALVGGIVAPPVAAVAGDVALPGEVEQP